VDNYVKKGAPTCSVRAPFFIAGYNYLLLHVVCELCRVNALHFRIRREGDHGSLINQKTVQQDDVKNKSNYQA
jgi:hypothetical protein